MEPRIIRSEAQYRATLAEVGRLMDAPAGSDEAERCEVLALLVEAYERTHYPVGKPSPVEAITACMELRGLSRKDLEPYIGSRARVSEVLTGVRELTLPMIRRLHAGLGISVATLVGPELAATAASPKPRTGKSPPRVSRTTTTTKRKAAKRRAG